MRREIAGSLRPGQVVIVDEIQRLPELLNEVHLMIEEMKLRFVLTGSSARALRRKGVNLLGGRARTQLLHPLVSHELGDAFDLYRVINHGALPAIYDSENPDDDLGDYCGTYLREEVAAEGLTRNVPAFSRFLEVAARSNGSMLNYTNIASDAQVKRSTVVDYFQILRDTLIGFDLEAWGGSRKRKAITTSKFYFFDLGVQRHLSGAGSIQEKSPLFGSAFEHFIFRELRSAVDYSFADSLHYWRSKSNLEVDFVLNESIAIECKAAATIRPADLRGLRAIREENSSFKTMLVCFVDRPQLIEQIQVIPWRSFLTDLWSGRFRG
jgi:predicted AAA+ superfamily ATPase